MINNLTTVENFFNYLPLLSGQQNWGLNVLNAGRTQVQSGCGYPMKDHPSKYELDWHEGRTLQEYQLIYITKGEGVFESESFEKTTIFPGMLILLFPGEKHRYKPSEDIGWEEYWIGFEGKIMDDLVEKKIFSPKQPCLDIGFNSYVFSLLSTIIDKVRKEERTLDPEISGEVLKLLACIYGANREEAAPNKEKEIVEHAKVLFHANISNPFSALQAASELSIGYSSFRKLFKARIGVSPGQFFINLKITRAKQLLADRSIPIKEIAFKLNFNSYFYFSKLFKDKTGISPNKYRTQLPIPQAKE